MSKIRITLPDGVTPVTGKQITFRAPCNSYGVDSLQINGVDYSIVNALGSTSSVIWSTGSLVTVTLDLTNNKAFILNGNTVNHHGTVLSANADNAEVGQWADGNPDDEDRLGYFVSIDTSTAGATMVKSTSISDVRGVTVSAPAFSGNCTPEKFDANGNLLKLYDYVAVMGMVSVIDNGTCTINGRCMPTDDGTAIPSNNKLGYQVIDRIDDTHILIAVEPGADMIQRIKNDMAKKADLDEEGKILSSQLPGISAAKSYTATIGTEWVEDENTGIKSQTVYIDGITADHTAKVDHYYSGDGTPDSYSTFVEEENQYLDFITNGYAETVDGGIKFNIFRDAPTIIIPVIVEVG